MEKINLDYNKLKGKIKEECDTQTNLAKLLQIDETTMSNKLNNNTYFTQCEIVKACNILHIDFIDIPKYFFTLKVRETEQIK